MKRAKKVKPLCECGSQALYMRHPYEGYELKSPLCKDCGERFVRQGASRRSEFAIDARYATVHLRKSTLGRKLMASFQVKGLDRTLKPEHVLVKKIRRKPHRRIK